VVEVFQFEGSQHVAKNLISMLVKWLLPPLGWFKLNCDGALNQNSRLASCGVVLRDENGRFLKGFSGCLGRCGILQVELWAILNAFKLVEQKEKYKLCIESNFLLAINLMTTKCLTSHLASRWCWRLRTKLESLVQLFGTTPEEKEIE